MKWGWCQATSPLEVLAKVGSLPPLSFPLHPCHFPSLSCGPVGMGDGTEVLSHPALPSRSLIQAGPCSALPSTLWVVAGSLLLLWAWCPPSPPAPPLLPDQDPGESGQLPGAFRKCLWGSARSSCTNWPWPGSLLLQAGPGKSQPSLGLKGLAVQRAPPPPLSTCLAHSLMPLVTWAHIALSGQSPRNRNEGQPWEEAAGGETGSGTRVLA